MDRTIVCQKRRYKGVAVFAKEGSDNNGGTETFSDGLIIFHKVWVVYSRPFSQSHGSLFREFYFLFILELKYTRNEKCQEV